MKKIIPLISLLVIFSSCSINRMAVSMVSNALSGSGSSTLFTGDNDPQLVGDALPFAMKVYEGLIDQDPENPDLLITTGSIFIMYANVYVHTPASMYPDDDYLIKNKDYARAKNLYLRGRDYLLDGLELRYSGFKESLFSGDYENAFTDLEKDDVEALYWAAAGWMSAISVDLFDMELTSKTSAAFSLILKALELDENYSSGSIHDFLLTAYGALPESMMFRNTMDKEEDLVYQFYISYYTERGVDLSISEEKVRYHFMQSVNLSKGLKVSPYVSLASSISVKNQDAEEFRKLLEAALNIDIDLDPANRLANLVSKEKASWLLDHIDDFILF